MIRSCSTHINFHRSRKKLPKYPQLLLSQSTDITDQLYSQHGTLLDPKPSTATDSQPVLLGDTRTLFNPGLCPESSSVLHKDCGLEAGGPKDLPVLLPVPAESRGEQFTVGLPSRASTARG